MRKFLMAAVLLVGAAALAQMEGHPGVGHPTGEGDHNRAAETDANDPGHHAEAGLNREEEEDKDVATTIVHHVADSDRYEFDIPLRTEGKNPVIHFPVWRINLKSNACPADDRMPADLGAGCFDVSITKHAFMMFIAAGLLLLVFLLGSHRDTQQLVPHGTSANLLEMLVLFVRNEVAIPNIGKKDGPRFVPYLLSIFFFILFMNLLGLFPWMSTPTANLGVTVALAACTFFVTQAAAIKSAGLGGFLKHLDGGAPWWLMPLMVPIEILGLFTKPFALTMRLFANMLAGHIVIFSLLGLIFILGSAAVAGIAVPFAMAIYLLELFVCFVQAYVFCMLSAVFIGMGVAIGHHDHDAAHADEPGKHGEVPHAPAAQAAH